MKERIRAKDDRKDNLSLELQTGIEATLKRKWLMENMNS